MVAKAIEQLGGVDILVNCAAQVGGQAPPLMLNAITSEALWTDVNVKVMGYIRCIREVVPYMAKRGGGRIVNVGGLAVRTTGSTIGSIRNSAVTAMTKNLADELGNQGIAVIVVHPGRTRTEATPIAVRELATREGITIDDVERRMAKASIQGRLINAREVAQVIAFLVSPKAIAINGDAVVVGGGTPGSIYY